MSTTSVGMAPVKYLLALILVLMFTAPAFAGSSEAAGKVQEGIAQFKGGDFKAAAEAFSAADEALPNELKIAFDRGCAYAATGELDKAVEQFQKAAAASDHKLAGLANYNMGCVAVARAKAKLGQKPEEAEGEDRTAALEFLIQAARHYHDALSMDGENSDARYNLETIRLWIKHIQDVWQKRDRQKRRDSMNLLQYLGWLESEQRSLKQIYKELGAAKSSPRQREAIRAAEDAQRTLAEEIQPLKEKIAATLTAPQQQQPGANQAASPSADVQKAIELLHHLADDVRVSMGKAADSLAGESFSQAAESQSQAVETIDQIFMAVAPYANLVERGINRQEELINQSPAAEKQENANEQNASAKPAQHQPEAQARDSRAPFDGNEAAWNQRFIARYGRILSAKARRELEQLDAMPPSKQEPPPQSATSTAPNANSAQGPYKDRTGSDEQLKADEQRRDLKEALQLGVQSAPKVEKLADQSALLLEEDKPDEALPKQQEALKLLKDMLPKQQQKEQEKKDQEKKDQEKKDQNKKDQEKKDQDKKDQNKKDQEKKDQDKKDQQRQQQQNQQPQTKRDLNKEKAEAVLQRARQREDQHRELEKKLEGYLYRPEKVEKDW
ncbi:MAG: hypothetical protein ABSG67_01240 [Thermoguttaceae bacterium]